MKPHLQDAHVAYVERQKSGTERLGSRLYQSGCYLATTAYQKPLLKIWNRFKAMSKCVLLSYNSLSEAFIKARMGEGQNGRYPL